MRDEPRSLAARLAAASLPVLRRLPPELAHRLALGCLDVLRFAWRTPTVPEALRVQCAGLSFAHPVGVAAGFDKDGDYLDALGAVGFSHVEIGTVTPRPQAGNPKPRLFRIPAAGAVVNRMGFNSKGIDYVVRRLERSAFGGVRGLSIGKNAATPIESAASDYVSCFRKAYAVADYVAINVSSPNTPQLRELQSADALRRIVEALHEERARLSGEHGKRVPLFVKLAPDLTPDQWASLPAELRRLELDGIIATNTTVDFEGVRGVLPIHEGGGLSGEPLHRRSLAAIARLRSELGAAFPLIGVGGIMDAAAARATLAAGANVLQLYTGLVYRGPELLDEILEDLSGRPVAPRAAAPPVP